MIVAILLMAGQSERFGGPLPKQYQLLQNKPLYLHTLERLQSASLFDHIILVVEASYQEIIRHEGMQIVQGGATRRESSYRGLLACPPGTEYVLIHDAVRPFVSKRILQENVEAVKKYQAVDTCIPSPDTIIKRAGDFIEQIPDRSFFMRGQTPQTFSYELIKRAHEEIPSFLEHVDDCRLVLELGTRPYIVKGEERNFKITTEEDFLRAQSLCL